MNVDIEIYMNNVLYWHVLFLFNDKNAKTKNNFNFNRASYVKE